MRPPDTFPAAINFVVDGDIPTTAIVDSVLRAVFETANVHLRVADELSRNDAYARPSIFSRICAPHLKWLPSWMTTNGARYAYFLDDNFWEYREDNDVGRYYSRPDVRETLDEFILHASALIVNSHFLANQLRARFRNITVFVVPAPFDFANIQPLTSRNDTIVKPLRIGYAGSERGGAFVTASQAIKEILQARPNDVEFEFIGYLPETLKDTPGVTYFDSIGDYPAFIRFKESRCWDAGLAPLIDDAFTRAKTNNKFREYGALGIVGIYSATDLYRDCVTHGSNGLLVDGSTRGWLDAFDLLLDNPHDIQKMAKNAYADVWRMHRLEKVTEDWRHTLPRIELKPAIQSLRSTAAWQASQWQAWLGMRLIAYSIIRDSHGVIGLMRHLCCRLGSLFSR